jgi:hypothetical protein
MQRPKIKPKWNSRAAKIKQETARSSKLKFKYGTDFLTRKRGTPKQIGQKFPVTSSAKTLPKISHKIAKKRYPVRIVFKDGKSKLKYVTAGSQGELAEKTAKMLRNYKKGQVSQVQTMVGGKWTDFFKHSYNIAKGYLGRASKFVESAAEATGRIAGAPQKVREAYERGRNPQAAEIEQLKKAIDKARLESQLKKYQNIKNEYMGVGAGNLAARNWRQIGAKPVSVAAKKIELELLRKRISAYERAGVAGRGLNSMKLRAQQLEEEIQAAGGKRAGGKRQSRDRTKHHSYGGLRLEPYSITDSEKTSFEKRSKWSSRARTK